MSVPQFAVATGFYTEAETREVGFRTGIRGIFPEPRDEGVTEAQLQTFWSTIADGPYSSLAVESAIRDPVFRYIRRIIACTLVGRRSGPEKVSFLDLACLYCILGQHDANLACPLLASFGRRRRGGERARIDMGTYIA
jgi:hypothetical protein